MKNIILGFIVLVFVSGLFGQDSILKDQIKLKDSVYYYKDKPNHIGFPKPTPTYHIDSLKCPNDTITYLKQIKNPCNSLNYKGLSAFLAVRRGIEPLLPG